MGMLSSLSVAFTILQILTLPLLYCYIFSLVESGMGWRPIKANIDDEFNNSLLAWRWEGWERSARRKSCKMSCWRRGSRRMSSTPWTSRIWRKAMILISDFSVDIHQEPDHSLPLILIIIYIFKRIVSLKETFMSVYHFVSKLNFSLMFPICETERLLIVLFISSFVVEIYKALKQ